MVHELLTINNNQVDLSHVEDIKPDLQKLLLCAEQDDLYKQVFIYFYILIYYIIFYFYFQTYLEYIQKFW